MFDANSDAYSSFFINYSGLSINNDSTDNGRYLRARFVPNLEGTSPSGLFTTFASGQSLSDNRVTVARFKHIGGNVDVDDNATYHGSTTGTVMMQLMEASQHMALTQKQPHLTLQAMIKAI